MLRLQYFKPDAPPEKPPHPLGVVLGTALGVAGSTAATVANSTASVATGAAMAATGAAATAANAVQEQVRMAMAQTVRQLAHLARATAAAPAGGAAAGAEVYDPLVTRSSGALRTSFSDGGRPDGARRAASPSTAAATPAATALGGPLGLLRQVPNLMADVVHQACLVQSRLASNEVLDLVLRELSMTAAVVGPRRARTLVRRCGVLWAVEGGRGARGRQGALLAAFYLHVCPLSTAGKKACAVRGWARC